MSEDKITCANCRKKSPFVSMIKIQSVNVENPDRLPVSMLFSPHLEKPIYFCGYCCLKDWVDALQISYRMILETPIASEFFSRFRHKRKLIP